MQSKRKSNVVSRIIRKIKDRRRANIILEEMKYSACYKIKNEMSLLVCGRVDEKNISPGRSGGNICIFFSALRRGFDYKIDRGRKRAKSSSKNIVSKLRFMHLFTDNTLHS